jgi:hypothetical protein
MIVGGTTAFGLRVDFLILVLALTLLIALAARLYPRIIM